MTILPAIQKMQPGDHYCGIYRTDEDHRAMIVDFVKDGIARHEKIVYLVHIRTAEQLREMLSAAGIDAAALVDAGQLVILTANEAYLKDGQFDPDKMIALLEEETDTALAEGYAALRATGEMTWALAGEPGSERLVEYESRVNELFNRSKKCYGLCQYDRRRFDAEMLVDIVQVHPNVLYGKEGLDNRRMYFVPPQKFLDQNRQGAVLDTWLTNLSAKGE